MNRPKHAPGPWRVNRSKTGCILSVHTMAREVNTDLCNVGDSEMAENRANAALIAAAPDLLEACYFVRVMLNEAHPDNLLLIKKLDSAITKAKGGG